MKTHSYFGLFVLLLGLFSNSYLSAQDNTEKKVMVLKIRDEIDPRMERYVKLALENARAIQADLVLVDMNSYGGRVDNADEIASAILDFEKPIHAFINTNAASAGAWISIACDSIFMAEGGSIGAVTVVGGDGTAMPDKYQSYMRSRMRSTAAAKGRDPRIAEAMVDQNLSVPGISDSGKVITFTTDEALKYDYCDGKAESIEEVMTQLNISNYTVETYQLSSIEKIVRVFLNPYLSGILLLIILGGIYFELQTPGVGFPILAAAIASTLYFVPYYLTGLAANWELLLFIVGVLLLAAEFFVIPGFGVAGILGLFCTLGGLGLMTINNDGFDFNFVTTAEIYRTLFTVLIGFLGSIILFFVAVPRVLTSQRFKKISLQTSMSTQEGYHANTYTEDLLGKTGEAYTVLRPSGKVRIEGELYDASTPGGFVEKGDMIEVISQAGTSLKVRAVVESQV